MTTLHNILAEYDKTQYATTAGTHTHQKLSKITISPDFESGDSELINHIKQIPELRRLFSPDTKTEVPIAGTIKNRFISRRIDRLHIDTNTKTITILDYKTDINHEKFRTVYISQMQDYANLLHAIYPDHKIDTYILWTHDFLLEKLNIKPL